MVRSGNKNKHVSISGGSYKLRSGAKLPEHGSTSANPNSTIPLPQRAAMSSVAGVCNSVLDSLTKRKSVDPGVSQTPAASLGKPAHTSTPAMDPPGMDERDEAVWSRPSDISMLTITSHVSRRLSQKTSTSSGTSADVTVVGRPGETDLYVDESHV